MNSIKKRTRNPQAAVKLTVRITSAKIRTKKEGNRNNTWSSTWSLRLPLKGEALERHSLTKLLSYFFFQSDVSVVGIAT